MGESGISAYLDRLERQALDSIRQDELFTRWGPAVIGAVGAGVAGAFLILALTGSSPVVPALLALLAGGFLGERVGRVWLRHEQRMLNADRATARSLLLDQGLLRLALEPAPGLRLPALAMAGASRLETRLKSLVDNFDDCCADAGLGATRSPALQRHLREPEITRGLTYGLLLVAAGLAVVELTGWHSVSAQVILWTLAGVMLLARVYSQLGNGGLDRDAIRLELVAALRNAPPNRTTKARSH